MLTYNDYVSTPTQQPGHQQLKGHVLSIAVETLTSLTPGTVYTLMYYILCNSELSFKKHLNTFLFNSCFTDSFSSASAECFIHMIIIIALMTLSSNSRGRKKLDTRKMSNSKSHHLDTEALT